MGDVGESLVGHGVTLGYTFGKPIFYLSTEANDPVVATLEGATYTPALKDVPFALEDASPGEAAERIYAIVNGPTGIDNPFRQGIDSALSDKGTHGPLNVLGGIPTINLPPSLYRRHRNTHQIIDPINAANRISHPPVGFIINCPVVYRVN